ETSDGFDRLVGVVGDLVEVQIVFGDQLVAEQVFADVFVPGLPVSAAGPVNEHQRHQAALAGLHQGQRLVAFVHRAETARKQDDGICVAQENQFAREEILERNQFVGLLNDR